MKTLIARAIALLLLVTATALHAQVPQLINYQGRVAVGTVNFDGSGSFKFALVNGDGTATYWSNDGTSTIGDEPTAAVALTIMKGLYSVLLGDASLTNMTAIPASVFANPDVRLRVWFDDGVHGSQLLAPDQRLAPATYLADGAVTSASIAAGAITSAKIASGAVGQTQLAVGAVGAAQLANNAVGSAQLADAAITTAKIATGAVGNSQLAPGAVSGDVWSATSATGAPSVRFDHTAVWTGSEMIVWGGYGGSYLNDGWRYNPVLNTWAAVDTAGAPGARSLHTAVWTGSEMIVWGGGGNNDGGRYNPASNSWTLIPDTLPNTPAARRSHTAVWTGTEMVIWGGGIGGGIQGVTKFNDGGRYDPVSNSWTATASINAPVKRYLHTAVWTGSEMIVWGGLGQDYLDDGGRYNPAGDSWTPILNNLANTPAARSSHTAVWTGTQMIVFGGSGASAFSDGARYDPTADSWTSTASASAPRFAHTAVWTGIEMIVWGGSTTAGLSNSGERYNLATNLWAALTTANAPSARDHHTAVWSGSEMIVWGGAGSSSVLGDGARLRLSNILAGSIGGAQILAASIGSPQLALPLQFSGATASGSTLSGANTAAGGTGVAGVSSGGVNGVGVSGDGGSGTGVKGVANGSSSVGVSGTSASGTGVIGESTSGSGVIGTSTNNVGVFGTSTTGIGIFGVSFGSGLAGRFDGDVHVFGSLQAQLGGGTGILGGVSSAVEGLGAGGGTGVSGKGGSSNGIGVSGIGGINGYGIYGSSNQYAGYFAGGVYVTGTVSKAGGNFRIDHPLDPANKYLSHSFVESPDMMNIYNGNITLDAEGEAVVALPEWFGVLNKEFRYQLTCLGGFAPVYIAEEIADNRFKIAGGKPGLKVSWQVTGVRQDAWANAHRIPIEEEKTGKERGTYLHPELFGQPAGKSVEWARHPELMRERKERPAGPPAAPKPEK